MSDTSRDPAYDRDIQHSDWPIVQRDRDAGGEEGRAEAHRRNDPESRIDADVTEDDLEWIGFYGSSGRPFLYAPQTATLYEGELDEENERIVLREENRREVDEASLGDRIEGIGDEHDWEWLSSFARTYLEDETDERPSFRHRDTEFQRRNVAQDDPYDLAFIGSHTFVDESEQVHVIERFFNVYLAGSDVTDVEVKERYFLAEEPAAERRAGDATVLDENERDLDVTVDVSTADGESELLDQLNDWHTERVGWHRELESTHGES